MVTTSYCIRTGIVYTTLEAPMEKTQGIVVAGQCTMVSFQGLEAGTVESILNIWSSALRSASLSKLAASTGAFSSGTLLSKIFSSYGMLLYLLGGLLSLVVIYSKMAEKNW